MTNRKSDRPDYQRRLHNPHSFYWRSELTDTRKFQINHWIGSLSPEDRSMLDDLLRDVRADEQDNARYQACSHP